MKTHLGVVGVCVLTLLIGSCADITHQSPIEKDAWFVEKSSQVGVDFKHHSGSQGDFALPEITGGGVALVDVDNDADLDLFFVQGGCLSETCPQSLAHGLYINAGNGLFITTDYPIHLASQQYGMGVTTGDYDNDGDVDLFVSHIGPNLLLRNDGTGRFLDVSNEAGLTDDSWGTSATFADFDQDGYLDLYVANYMHWSSSAQLDCSSTSIETYCLPMHDYAAMDRVYRNLGDGTFENRTLQAGLASAIGNGLGVVANDFNNDGQVDVFVANDSMVNQLWINQGGFTFVDEAWNQGVAMDDHGIEKAGMGVVSFDYDADQDFDIVVVNIEGQTDSLFRNEGNYFTDVTGISGLGLASRRFTRFGLVSADFNNDGCFDLYQANGKVFHNEADLSKADYFAEPNVLYQGFCESEQRFKLIAPSEDPSRVHTSRGAAVGDLNQDGLLDLVVVNKDSAAYVLMGKPKPRTQSNWVRFRAINLLGRDDYNAKITISVDNRQIVQHVQTDGSYLSASEPYVHFGLKTNTNIQNVKVNWLDGTAEHFGPFDANETYTLTQGKASP